MTDEARKAMERERARLLEALAAVERDIAEHDRLMAKYTAPGSGPGPTLLPQHGKHQVVEASVASLTERYKTHKDSGYHKLSYRTRLNYDSLIRRIVADQGDQRLADLKGHHIQKLYENWSARGAAMGRSLITMLRLLFGFGATVLGDEECERLSIVLHKMRFPMVEARKEQLTIEQANAIRAKAHEMDWHSVALAQAFQFECGLKQKDVIGEWVPLSEPGLGEVDDKRRGTKWMRGLRWQEIDANLVLRHVTTSRQTSSRLKQIEVNLRLAPMVMEELNLIPDLPSSGPVIINEVTRQPFRAVEFRRRWRICADEVGVPRDMFNMDSRTTPEKAQHRPPEHGQESERTRPIRS